MPCAAGSSTRRALLQVGCLPRTGGRKNSYQTRIGSLDVLWSERLSFHVLYEAAV